MTLGGGLVVDRPLRKRKTVMGAGIDLDLGIGTVGLHLLFYFLDDLHWRVDVGLGATEIEFGLGLLRGQIRAVGLVGRQMRSVDRCSGPDALRKMRRRVDRIASAHAVADAADDVGAGSRLLVGIGEQGFGILHHQRDVDRVHQLEHALALGRFRVGRQRAQLHYAGAVVEIGKHHVIA